MHRVQDGGHVYFLANVGGEQRKARIWFKHGGLNAAVLDPMTRRTVRRIQLSSETGEANIEFAFEPFQSFLVVFDEQLSISEEATDDGTLPDTNPVSHHIDITDNWTLRIPEMGFEQRLTDSNVGKVRRSEMLLRKRLLRQDSPNSRDGFGTDDLAASWKASMKRPRCS